jgi:radical SAM-linked protein
MAHMNQSLTQQRIRIRFGKQGPLRFVGHLDFAKTWERVLRRAQIPLEYSQGFNPHPRMQFAAALPVGVTSECEYLDVWLTARLDGTFDEWIERLAAVSPSGLPIHAIAEVPIKQDALPTLVTHADYVITPLDVPLGPDELQRRVAGLLAAPAIERVRNKKTYDLRPLIIDLSVSAEGQVLARLVTGDQGMGRPDELLDALGLELSQARIHRQRLALKEIER